jgi:hypothetical protein
VISDAEQRKLAEIEMALRRCPLADMRIARWWP